MMNRPTRLSLLTAAAGAFAAMLLACGGGRMSECEPVDVDTSGWRELHPRGRQFALTLPPTAMADTMMCIDSACGRIRVGRWVLHYDMGRMAGPGDSVHARLGATDVRICSLTLASRPAHLLRARMPADRGYPPGRNHIAAAALPVSEDEGGLYFHADSLSERDVDEFAAAVRTLRLIPFTPPTARNSTR